MILPATSRRVTPIALAFATLLAILNATRAHADLATGMFAYDQGDYTTALAEWTPLAEDGDPTAQALLGLMYRGTPGLQADNAVSAGWYRRAAEQGHPHAQYNLGLAYQSGRGVEQDDVAAHMWLDLAARGIPTSPDGSNAASQRRDALAAQMTPAEITEATRQADSWTADEK